MLFGDDSFLPFARKLCTGPVSDKAQDAYFVRTLAQCLHIWHDRHSATTATYIQLQLAIALLLLPNETDRKIVSTIMAGLIDPTISSGEVFDQLTGLTASTAK